MMSAPFVNMAKYYEDSGMSKIQLPYTRKYILFPYFEIKPVCPLEHPKSNNRTATICSAVVCHIRITPPFYRLYTTIAPERP